MSPSNRPQMGSIPKPDDDTKDRFRSLVPDHPSVTVRPMFGNLAAFVNGNMFMGLFGSDLFVRLADADREALLKAGGGPFEPMPGRAMGGYVTVPAGWQRDVSETASLVDRSFEHSSALPPKQPKPAKRR